MEEGKDLIIAVSQCIGVVCIGSRTLETVGHEFLQTGHVRAQLFKPVAKSHDLGFLEHGVSRGWHGPVFQGCNGLRRLSTVSTGLFIENLGTGQHTGRLVDHLFHAISIEIDIGHRGEQSFGHKNINGSIPGTELTGSMSIHGNGLGHIDQQVLQVGNDLILATHTNFCASFSRNSLLTLITKHRAPFLNESWLIAS